MSAFVVEDKTINRVITWLTTERDIKHIHDLLPPELVASYRKSGSFNLLGKAMFALNVRSVEERYGEGEAKNFRKLNYQPGIVLCSTMQAYKSLKCWLYQSCEGECDKDPLYKVMEQIEGEMARHIVNRMPEYEKGEWS